MAGIAAGLALTAWAGGGSGAFAGPPGEPALRYWSDSRSGLAIGGYDPVAYFTRGEAVRGQQAFESEHAGVVWRFANKGNMAAFLAHPEVYAPRFGGYSPPGLARGVAVAGSPHIWAMHENRVYFFHSPVHKILWDRERGGVLAAAREQWPAVRARLPR